MIITPSFKDFVQVKDNVLGEAEGEQANGQQKDWKKEFVSLEKGFIPPPKMRPIIQAFIDSGEIKLQDDTTKEVKMPKKVLFLTGGSTRDFVKGKSPQDYHLVTNATPSQTAHILHAAGFRLKGDPKTVKKMKLTFEPKPSEDKSKKVWYIKNMDKSGSIYSVTAVVLDEEFDIETLRKDPKTSEVQSAKEFVDNPTDDSKGRDLTMNACYIELSKADGENNKMYDPTGKGWHDTKNDVVRTVGKPEDCFKQDPSRVLRTLRFHGRFGKGELDKDIKRAIDRNKNLDGVDLQRIRDEFLKGLMHPDTNVKKFVRAYQETGIIKKLFPNVELNIEIPPQFSTKRDKPLALAWLLQNNPIEKVIDSLASDREEQGEKKKTGWSDQEKRAVLFLLSLKEFTPNDRPKFLKDWKGAGLSKDQVRDWVEMFNIVDTKGRVRNKRPLWALHVKAFADNDKPLATDKDVAHLPHSMRGQAIDQTEIEKFVKLLPNNQADED